MFLDIWETFVFLPVVNVLMYLYSTVAVQNYGLAIAALVVIIRLILLPLSILEERNKLRMRRVADDVARINEKYASDEIQKNQLIKATLKKNGINPWPKLISLTVQAFILTLLYFVNNFSVNYLDKLYDFVPPIEKVDTIFFGLFDVMESYWPLAIICGFYLFVGILAEHASRRETLTDSDRYYRYLFPMFMIIILGILPAFKSIFVLTSMIFTTFVGIIRRMIYGKKVAPGEVISLEKAATVVNENKSPWDNLRKS